MFATAAAIFSVLLIITGVAKVARPHDVERALTSLGLPRIPFAGTMIGLGEIGIGVGAFFLPVALALQGVAYLVFAGWIVAALRADVPLASCGCLGKDDTPPSWGHFTLNVIGSLVSLAAAWSEPARWSFGLEGFAMVSVVAVGVFLGFVVLTDAARLAGVRTK